MKKNILVFPCGSEIALEVYRSVKNSSHFNLIGASSVDDHGKYVYENYIGGIPYLTEPSFLETIKRIVIEKHIDAIYPAMDSVIEFLTTNNDYIGCKVIASCSQTAKICVSKRKTYEMLIGTVKTPHIYNSVEETNCYPVFIKPDVGYGSRGAKTIYNKKELTLALEKAPSSIICEHLSGDEYTVDCFTDRNGNLIVVKPRKRCRVMNGISVNTKPVLDTGEFMDFAKKINNKIKFNGAWFFQVKRDSNGFLTLLEIASRFAGSSSLFRAKGINFALMSLYNAFDIPISVVENDYDVEMDRALDNKYKINISYNEVFVDFDDCICLEKMNINTSLIAFLYHCINKGIKITLLSKHDDKKMGDLDELLEKLRIHKLFDRIIHLKPYDNKYKYIDNKKSIFIDDSFSERQEIKQKCGIPVFSLDMVEVL